MAHKLWKHNFEFYYLNFYSISQTFDTLISHLNIVFTYIIQIDKFNFNYGYLKLDFPFTKPRQSLLRRFQKGFHFSKWERRDKHYFQFNNVCARRSVWLNWKRKCKQNYYFFTNIKLYLAGAAGSYMVINNTFIQLHPFSFLPVDQHELFLQ